MTYQNMSEDVEVITVTHCALCKEKFTANEGRYGDLGEPQQYHWKCYAGLDD